MEITFELFQLLTTLKNKTLFTHFSLKSFERNSVILFQVFLRKSEKLIIGGPNKNGGSAISLIKNKRRREQLLGTEEYLLDSA